MSSQLFTELAMLCGINCVLLQRLFGDGTELCWQGTHLKYAIPTILFVGLVLVPAPFLLALFNYKVANSDNQLKVLFQCITQYAYAVTSVDEFAFYTCSKPAFV